MRRLPTRVTVLALAAVLAFSAVASATPTVAITTPLAGSTFSRAVFDTISVTGTATFDAPVAATRKFYLRREVCGANNPGTRLSTVAGGETIGCGGLYSAATPIVDTYPAQNGLPVVVDATKQAKLTIVTGAWVSGVGGGIGQEKIDVTLTGVTAEGETKTIGTGTKTTLVTPDQDEVTTVIDIPLQQLTDVFTAFTMRTSISGTVMRSYVSYGGASFLEVPIMDVGTVQVSSDSSTFSATKTVDAVFQSDGTWAAEIPVPSAGARTIYARAVQGATKINAEPVSITVTN